MTDPYNVLGVPSTSSDEEIRRAYRELAKIYHPDNFATDPEQRKAAEEKMKEINDAFQQIRDLRKGADTARPERPKKDEPPQEEGFGQMRPIRVLINDGQTARAEALLDAIPAVDRNAEWNFLRGCILVQRGWYVDAQTHLETACYLDPGNAEYRSFLQNLRSGLKDKGKKNETKKSSLSDFSCSNAVCDCFGGEFTCC